MRIVFLILISIQITSCLDQIQSNTSSSQDVRNPHIPPMDSLNTICDVVADSLVMVKKTEKTSFDKYYLNDNLFSGWACEVFENTEHKYRYTYYRKGELKRQIGYYENGSLDHDFRSQKGKSIGNERMWSSDGSPYIDHFYSAPGVLHDIQRTWHADSILSKEALYDEGTLIYEVTFDKEGSIIDSKGKVPRKYKK